LKRVSTFKIRIPHQLQIALMAIAFGMLIAAVLIVITGNNPFSAYWFLFRGGLMSIKRIGNTLAGATTLILTGLSVAFAFRTGLFNIGAAGQMLFGGFVATALGLTLNLPKAILLPVMMLGAMLGGAFWGFIPGLLKAKFNVHEVVATIMMNFIALWIAYYGIQDTILKDPNQETQSARLPVEASLQVDWLRDITGNSFLNLGLIIAIIFVVIIAIIINKTVLGYQLKAAGYNRFAAEYAGMKVNRNIILSMAIAGALAGLAGFTFYAGFSNHVEIGKLPIQGFDGIAVALLGGSTPVGALFAALFFGILQTGKGFMQSMTGVPPEVGDLIIGFILYGAACQILFERILKYFKRGRNA
jgi:ABC-type uncharacterized transport system permease subunit